MQLDPRYTEGLRSFAEDLRALRISQGKPPLDEIRRNAPQDRPLSTAALSEALNGKRLPRLEFLMALIETLLLLGRPPGGRASVRADPRLREWQDRWEELQLLQSRTRQPQPADPVAEQGGQPVERVAEPVVELVGEPVGQRPARGKALRVFVAMPGSAMGPLAGWSDIPAIRKRVLEPAARRIGEEMACAVELVVEKEKSATGAIHRSMFAEATAADVYIADLTGANPNVYLELGVRWAMSDGVTIPICQRLDEVKFNVATNRVIVYGPMPDALDDAVTRITDAAVHGLRNPEHGDSPVREGAPALLVPRHEHEALRRELEGLREQQALDLVEAALRTEDPIRRGMLLRRAVDRNPASWQAYFQLGELLRREGQYPEAAAMLRRSVEIKPDLAVGWRQIGVALSQSGSPEREAVDAFDRALALDGRDAETWATQGGLLRRQARKSADEAPDTVLLERSLVCYSRASELTPNKIYPLMNRARVELLLGGLRGEDVSPVVARIHDLEHLARFEVSNHPSDPWALFDLGDTFLLTGRTAQGLDILRAAAAFFSAEQRAVALATVAAPLRDFLAITEALGSGTADAVHRALETCELLSWPES
ncbi:tetratricopeptide repeat protein [Streptacidiphilus sp. P02-A3a]|uniref:tetratricopeptide repeat protein n=1 Tax=Streptacidiphilus sp. P02-A3a TaxID=2704468 RepID=UPI0015F78F73|nr:tetratricopeptide repeat protein [Streptacidiphilus sp. P02-A3a]QMU72789.1 tetratricopeptide repeat protein [Streptacidiphilus sp. P02-A3a]